MDCAGVNEDRLVDGWIAPERVENLLDYVFH